MLTTVGQVMVNEVLPEKYRDYSRSMGASEAKAVLTRMALENPEKYKEVSNKLVMLGARASFDEGITLSISDTLNPVRDRREMLDHLRAQKARIMQSSATPEEKEKAIEALNDKVRVYFTDTTYSEGIRNQNPFALQVASKARGSPAQLVSLQTSPGTYTDMNGKQIPIFIEHSFAEGLAPHEYWAGTYGARKSVTCLGLDTPVRMADGSSRRISEIKPGDKVMGCDKDGNVGPVDVVRVYDNGVQPVFRFTFLGPHGETPFVDATEEHKMFARLFSDDGPIGPERLIRLGEAIPGHGDSRYIAHFVGCGDGCEIISRRQLGELPVMDIEVDSPDHMFVLDNGLVSANSTKFATRDAGALGKQYNRAAMRLVVADNDCGTRAGIPVDPSDIDNIGSVLSSDAPPYKAGTVITKEVLQDLKDKYDEILVRSPLTCGCKEGLCAKCVGIRETGKFPEIGSHVGLQASSALAERIAQGSLNCLAAGTLVRMADGTDRKIEDVKKGEIVMGSDLDGNIAPTMVVDVFDNGIQPCVETVFGTRNGDEIEAVSLCSTSIHKVLGSIGGNLDKFEVGIEGEFWVQCNHPVFGTILLKRLSQTPAGYKHVYDLSVSCPDHIFLLANGLIVSNTKHSSGVSQGKGKVDDGDTYAGFDIIDNLFQIPKEFPHRAAVSTVSGTVESVEPAPQGGWNIVVDGKTHYAISETRPRCKVGDYVEAGDQLSTGLMNPADVVKYKGIGEGRRYLMNRATKAYRDSGYAVNRRNMEVLVRGFLDNVRIGGNEGLGNYLPDDVVSYSELAGSYAPRKDSAMRSVSSAVGSYLEEPVMHYTIGTRVTRNVAKQLKRHGHENIFVNDNPPGFEPEATPLKLISRNEKDWVDQLGGTYLKSNILNAAHRGATSEIHSLQPEHAVARGVELGNPPPASQFGKKWVY